MNLIVRSKCRKVERVFLSYLECLDNECKENNIDNNENTENKENITSIKLDYQLVGKYFNRLSDYFFVSARYINNINKVEDIVVKVEKNNML